MSKPLELIVVCDAKWAIGKNGGFPWGFALEEDLKRFKEITTATSNGSLRNAVVMGRKTWGSLPEKARPLLGRLNVVLSRNQNNVEAMFGGNGPDDASTQSNGFDSNSKRGSNNSNGSTLPSPCNGVGPDQDQEVAGCTSLEDALQLCESDPSVEKIFVIGGAEAYKAALELDSASSNAEQLHSSPHDYSVRKIHWTRVSKIHSECDAYLEPLDLKQKWQPTAISKTKVCKCPKSGEALFTYDFVTLENSNNVNMKSSTAAYKPVLADCEGDFAKMKDALGEAPRDALAGEYQFGGQFQHEEYQYLDQIRACIRDGDQQLDRTHVGTLATFGTQHRWSLRDGVVPILTTKRVFWRGVIEELLWFLRGDTNAKNLAEKGVKIWDANGSKEFLATRPDCSHRQEGDLGPVYGYQWRHFGHPYDSCNSDYTGKGFDQIANIIHALKTKPTDRRMIFSAWNPAAMNQMALPPCHLLAQFFVKYPNTPDAELSCLLYQRAGDMGLGVPFNIASYAALTCLMAQIVGMKRGDFVHQQGNVHVYLNHIDPLLGGQVNRLPRPFPLLKLNPAKTDIDADWEFADFELVGYNPHPKVKMEMAL